MAANTIGNEKQNQKSFGEVIGKDVLHFTQIKDHSTMLDIKRLYIQLPHDYSNVRQKWLIYTHYLSNSSDIVYY